MTLFILELFSCLRIHYSVLLAGIKRLRFITEEGVRLTRDLSEPVSVFCNFLFLFVYLRVLAHFSNDKEGLESSISTYNLP
jgi:hypothetical protein